MSRHVFHPFFLLDLVRLCRQGQFERAAKTAFAELQIALAERKQRRNASKNAGDDDDAGGVVLVPSPKRQRELWYHTDTPRSTQDPVQEADHDRFKF